MCIYHLRGSHLSAGLVWLVAGGWSYVLLGAALVRVEASTSPANQGITFPLLHRNHRRPNANWCYYQIKLRSHSSTLFCKRCIALYYWIDHVSFSFMIRWGLICCDLKAPLYLAHIRSPKPLCIWHTFASPSCPMHPGQIDWGIMTFCVGSGWNLDPNPSLISDFMSPKLNFDS